MASATRQALPHDLEAERGVLAAAVWRPGTLSDLVDHLVGEDFYGPAHGAIWEAAYRLHDRGVTVNPPSVTGELESISGGTFGRVQVADLANVDWVGWWDAAGRVVTLARRRKAVMAASELLEAARTDGCDPTAVIDQAVMALGSIDRPIVDAVPDGLVDVDTLVDREPSHRSQWLIPGLLRREWRVMIVGPEGAGKSVIGRQIAIMSAQGVHPFTLSRFPSVRTLIVDLENPDDVIADTARPVRDRVRIEVGQAYETGRAWVWSRPGGVDLRVRGWRRQLEAVLAWCRPDLVYLGPLYKAFRKHDAKESAEDAAADVQVTLDDLRTRYGFGLMIEHHAPKAQGGFRDWSPFGSSLWLRWPEIGIGLKPDKKDLHHLTLTRWRGDRAETCWPDELEWGKVWPWVARYADGVPQEEFA